MNDTPLVFIGYDPNETVAYHVLVNSIMRHASRPVQIVPVMIPQVPMWREKDPLQSTDFAFSRFLVPYLCKYQGWAIFMDCDFLCRTDITELWNMRDPRYKVMCCKHDYVPAEGVKFLGQKQTKYTRKNWSSLMMFNNACCTNLTPEHVNTSHGLSLHRMDWAVDEQIGDIPLEWNWLVGVYGFKKAAKMVHFTLGTPCFAEYATCDYSKEWHREKYLTTYHAR